MRGHGTAYSDYQVHVIEPKWVTIVFPAGYEIRDRDYRLVGVQSPHRDPLRAAMHQTSRFYR